MRFVCDVMLGKLARYLRLLGFDTVYAPNPASLKYYGKKESDRLLLTRRKGDTGFPSTLRLKSEKPKEQLMEMRETIRSAIDMESVLNRCIECNTSLIEAEKTEIESLVPEFVYHNYSRFKTCPTCKRVYWEGSHTVGMEDLIKEILA